MSNSISIIVKFKQPCNNKSSNTNTINYSYNIHRNFSQPKTTSYINSNTYYQQQLKQLRTIFTSSSTNSDVLCISSNPIHVNTLNQTFQTKEDLFNFSNSILKECTLYEYDKVYNERSSIINIYNDYVKVIVDKLFSGRNACIISFGPSNSGKEHLFLNINNISNTLLYKSISDVLNIISLSNNCNYELCLSAWLIYGNNNVNGLLMKNKVTIRKVSELENHCMEIFNKKRNICGLSNINEYDKKSHIKITITLYKDSVYQGQIDFVELACSDFAYGKKNSNKEIEKSINSLFDLISEMNIKNNNHIGGNNNKSLLNYYLTNTCCQNNNNNNPCDVLVINCIIPWENPLNFSLKSLKITNTLRNSIHNNKYTSSYKSTLTENSGRNYNTHYIQPKTITLNENKNYKTFTSSPIKTTPNYKPTQSPLTTMKTIDIPKHKNIAEIQKYRSFNLSRPNDNNKNKNINNSYFNKSHYNFRNINSPLIQQESTAEHKNQQNESFIQTEVNIASLKSEIVLYKKEISKLKQQLSEQTQLNIELQDKLNEIKQTQTNEEEEENSRTLIYENNKQNFQIELDYMILKSKHEELKEDYSNMINDFQNTKEMYQLKMKDIENKIDILKYEVDQLQKENDELHENQQSLLTELNEKEKMINHYKDLYNYEKEQKMTLEKELYEIKNNKETEIINLVHKEDNIQFKPKPKYANELKGKIKKYKDLHINTHTFHTEGNIN